MVRETKVEFSFQRVHITKVNEFLLYIYRRVTIYIKKFTARPRIFSWLYLRNVFINDKRLYSC